VADWAALSLDIETHPADEQRIFKLGAVRVAARQVVDRRGRVLVRLARRCDLPDHPLAGEVYAVMLRTRAMESPQYRAEVKVERWEVPLVEVMLTAHQPPAGSAVQSQATSLLSR
jgi:ATP-dependent DNA helicase RecQ